MMTYIEYYSLSLSIYLYFYKNRYENGWKALMAYTDGVILVYNPDSPGQDIISIYLYNN